MEQHDFIIWAVKIELKVYGSLGGGYDTMVSNYLHLVRESRWQDVIIKGELIHKKIDYSLD